MAVGVAFCRVMLGAWFKLGAWRDLGWWQLDLLPQTPNSPEPLGIRDLLGAPEWDALMNG